MNYDFMVALGPATGLVLAVFAAIHPVLTHPRLMQWLSAAPGSGSPAAAKLAVTGFVPLKNRKTSSSEYKPEDGAS